MILHLVISWNVATTVRASSFAELILIRIVTIQIGFSATANKAVLATTFDLRLFQFDNADDILRASFDPAVVDLRLWFHRQVEAGYFWTGAKGPETGDGESKKGRGEAMWECRW